MRVPRYSKILIAVLIVFVAITLSGFVWLRSTPYWAGITLFWESKRVENFRSMDTVFPYRPVARGGDVWSFGNAPRVLPQHFRFDGHSRNLADFLTDTKTAGLVVVHDGDIVFEDYRLGATERSKFTSWSMAKSVLSALIGIAVEEGAIESIGDPLSRYVPALAGSDYAEVSIEDVLTMSSGMGFNEDYDDPFSDVNMLFIDFATGTPMEDLLAGIGRVREPGVFNDYISTDTIALGLVLEAATGATMDRYLSTRLWSPMGAEDSAFWNTGATGQALATCCLNARLRDYARFGRLFLENGAREDVQIVPADWVASSVEPTAPHLKPGDNPASSWTFGYGYQWWIPEEPQREFLAIGIWGQYLYVDRNRRVVIVKASVDPGFDGRDHESVAAFRAIARSVAGQ